MRTLSPAEFERLRSWNLEIVATLLSDHRYQDQGPWRNFDSIGGFGVHRESGAWHAFSGNEGGISPISLIRFLKGCDIPTAIAWSISWLSSHVGCGTCNGEVVDDDDATPASALAARDAIDRAVDISNTPAELKLESRRLDAPFPSCAYLPDARCGEGALIGYLTASGRTVGVELRYIDPDGCDSTVSPKRRRLMLEKPVEQPVFEMPYSGDSTEAYVCEGLTDTLSVYRFGKRRCKILGVPGVNGFEHLKFAKGVRVTFVRDGDEETSAAFKAMERAIDVQLLAGVDLYVTPTPPNGIDASLILQEHGVDSLCLILDNPVKATLSLRGRIEELSKLDELDYAQQRKRVAKEYDISVETLDKYVKAARRGASASGSGIGNTEDLAPWPDPVDGIELLDAIGAAIRKHVVLADIERDATTLWVVFTWAFDAAFHAPKLLVRSPRRRCGKTRLFEVLSFLTRRGEVVSYTTGSALFRSIERYCPCILIDEVDTFLREHPQLRGLINGGFDRLSANIKISVPLPGGGFEDKTFSIWAPQGIAGIGKTHETITDRSFVIELTRKLRSQKVAPLRHRDTPPLVELARKAMRWVSDHTIALKAADPEIPESVHDRAADAWVVPMAIADIAGGDWPERARRAAEAMHGVQAFEDDDVRILLDIRNIFAARGWPKAIFSKDLVEALRAIEDGPWTEYRGSWPITQPQVAAELKPFHVLSGTVRIGNKTAMGYKLAQLRPVFAAYLSEFPPTPPRKGNTSTQAAGTQGFQAGTGPTQDQNVVNTPNTGTNTSDTCVGPATPKNPSDPAGCVDVLTFEGGMTGRAEDTTPLDEVNGAEVWVQGITPASNRTGSAVEEKIRQLHHEHADWSIRRISRECGVTHKVVSRVLGQTP